MSHLYSKNIHDLGEHVGNSSKINRQLSSRQSLKAKFDRESKPNESLFTEYSSELSRSNFSGGWCDAVSSSLPNVNAKRAWKSGTEKLSQTLNNVRSTFGIISQKIKKKRRQPLINLDSPTTPVTSYARSKALLGRTPTKLYSPFDIDTPKGKENKLSSDFVKKNNPSKGSIRSVRRKFKNTIKDSIAHKNNSLTSELKLSDDALQTQIGIYELHSVANRILQK